MKREATENPYNFSEVRCATDDSHPARKHNNFFITVRSQQSATSDPLRDGMRSTSNMCDEKFVAENDDRMDLNSLGPQAAGDKIGASSAARRTTPAQHYSIQLYENSIPAFVEEKLDKLYANIFSSLPNCRVHGHAVYASTYAVLDGTEIVTLWLFRKKGSEVHVLNEGIPISGTEIELFCDHIFATHPCVTLITFHAVQSQLCKLSRPYQRFNCLEDMVVVLPKSTAEYKAGLGKSTRACINRYMNKLGRDYPLLRFETYSMDAISEEMVRELVALNHLRMTHKGRVSNNDEVASALITELAKARGHICVFILDGKIVAGTINYQAGNNYFLEVVAHDPAFDDYRLGMLSCYLTINECIDRGGCEYHLLWGQDEYKHRLKAVQRDLDHLSIYRSRRAMLAHGDMLLKNMRDRALRVARLWLRRARKEETRTGRMALAAIHGLRSIRNFTKARWSM